jgi:hypothetical protein
MPLQDLTPELRTRLNRVERMVGWFVTLATLCLLASFAYYIYATAKTRGWFVTKINFATGVNDASGFKLGDPIKLMGFNVGEVTGIVPNDPDKARGVTIFFNVRDPYYGYVWYDSQVRVVSDFLNNRYLEVEKGRIGAPSVYTNSEGKLFVLNRFRAWGKFKSLTNEMKNLPANTNLSDTAILLEATNQLMKILKTETNDYYTNAFAAKYNRPVDMSLPPETRNYYWMPPLDTPALGDRLNAVADQVEKALPNILNLTNQLAAVLSNANNALISVNSAVAKTDPILTNIAVMTGNLRDPNGSLGNWLIPTNLATQLRDTLQSATVALKSVHATLDDTDTNVTMLAVDLDKTLQHLADLTGSLSTQVQANTNLVTEISSTIVHTDDLIQGLKRHWLLRSAFKPKPPEKKQPSPAPQPAHQR